MTGALFSLTVQPAAERSAERVSQLEGLFHFQIGQAFDFKDTAREDVFLARFGDGEQPLFDGIERDGVDEVAQGDARLQGAAEAHQHGFRHVQRHHSGRGGKGDKTGASGEGNADGEAGVRVAAGADGIGQKQAVQPGVDDAVAGAQRDAAACGDEGRQFFVQFDINRFRIGTGVAEGLHHHIGGEAEAGEVFQLVAGHGAGGVL